MVAKGAQKTKVKAIISLLSFAGNSFQQAIIAQSSDTARANYFDVLVKPFAKIQVLHLDLMIYQSGANVAADGFVDWCLIKNPGGSIGMNISSVNGTSLVFVPYTFRQGRAAVPMLTSTGMPTIYHLVGDIKIPPRFQTMNPGDIIQLNFAAIPAAAGVSYSVNGTVSYMFKV